MTRPLSVLDSWAGWLAAALAVLAALGFAVALPPFSHALHPLGLLGAPGVPHALAFNVLGFVLPGLLAMFVAVRLRGRLPESVGRVAPLGAWMLAISALAFAAQGVFTLDPAELDGGRSQWHATAWLLWWLSFATGSLLLGLGWRRSGFVALGALVIVLSALPGTWLPGPIAQRLLLLAWCAGVVLASRSR